MKRFALLTASAVLYFLGLVGFDIWPLALVAFVPALWALDSRYEPPLGRLPLLGLLLWHGAVTMAGGYYWVVETLERFSGFPWVLCFLFATLLWIYQGGSLALILWLTSRGLGRGYGAALSLTAAVCFGELVYPQLFGWYLGNAFHNLPYTIQIADLGGPIAVSAVIALTNGGLYEALRRTVQRQPLPRASLVAAAATWCLTLGYGAYRVHEVDARAAAAPQLEVGIVQANVGLWRTAEDVERGLQRHIEQTLELEEQGPLDLVVWPESAFGYYIPERVKNVQRNVLGPVRTPTLFGGLRREHSLGKTSSFNTAFLTNAQGDVLGHYDKTYLLMFGEYIPFGDVFPQLYDYSPNSGRFTPGSHTRPLELNGHKLAVLICYEDILPGFVRQFTASSAPDMFINVTNDAWFGDSLAAWQHLALAKFRSVEHHRPLVRSTNSGVSAVIDPVGRVVVHSGLMERASLRATVPLLDRQTLYSYVGDLPGWLGLIAILWVAFGPRASTSASTSAKE